MHEHKYTRGTGCRLWARAKTSHSLRGKPAQILHLEFPINEYQDQDPWPSSLSKIKTQVLLTINLLLYSSSTSNFFVSIPSSWDNTETLSHTSDLLPRSSLWYSTETEGMSLWYQKNLAKLLCFNPKYDLYNYTETVRDPSCTYTE